MHRLFSEFAHRYDLHTPPEHYQHDHRFVLDLLRGYGSGASLLDVGCGTGVLVEKVLAAGLRAEGIDASPRMVEAARRRVGQVVSVLRMQDLDRVADFEVVAAMSWTFNYAEDVDDARNILAGFRRALRSGGTLVMQLAHADNATGDVSVDEERGPTGLERDVLFLYRFDRTDEAATMSAEYVYACRSARELMSEVHRLRVADAAQVANLAKEVGLVDVALYNSWRREAFSTAVSPLLVARNRDA